MAPQTLHAPCRLAVASSLLLAIAALAQKPAPAQPSIQDPANLAGERVSAPDLADTLPINHGAPALAQLLKKLRTRASLMMIVAHPDDEDGGMLTYESRGLGARVAMLTLTRGEGGQNLMTSDFNDALGLIRTQELLAADRYLGVDQFFGSVVDFGFSKTREETLEQWTHERVLYDTVRAVRLYRPLVLTSTWIGGVTDGHGHHQVSGQMNQEVFEAAADPRVFPEMGLPPWAPLKVYARMPFARIGKDGMFDYATGKSSPPRFYNYVTKQWTTTPPAANVMIPEGTTSNDPGMDGDTYLQFARKGLALQKTQIGGNVRPARAGNYDAPYTRYASRVEAKEKEQSFFDGIDTSIPGIADLAPDAAPTVKVVLKVNLGYLDESLSKAQHSFTTEHPEAVAPHLQEALKTIDFLIAQVESFKLQYIPAGQKFNVLHELRVKRVQCNNALVLALGVTLSAIVDPNDPTHRPAGHLASQSQSIPIQATLTNHGVSSLQIETIQIEGGEATPPGKPSTLSPGANHVDRLTFDRKSGFPITRPYFTRASVEQPFYTITDPALRDAPATPDPVVISATVLADGLPLHLRAALLGPNSPQGPDAPQAAVIVPSYTVTITSAAGVIAPRDKTIQATTKVQVGYAPDYPVNDMRYRITTTLSVPRNWTFAASGHSAKTDRSLTDDFIITPGQRAPNQRYVLKASATAFGHEYTESFRPVGYPGLTYTNYYTPATFKATAVDVRTAPNLKIAYLPGTGDDVATYLPNLGITPTLITPRDLTPASLAPFDAVLLGVRAYAAHPELANSAALLDYAKAGGVVIVQYNTARYGDDQSPYPITVPGDSAHNVVVEAQPVQILTPNSPVLTWPNTITSADFKGWTEELGHGFASSWDPHFEALTETHDPDQDPQQGGLLYARTGRGAYVYVAYALYRQLPEGVPGAYRLFANLLSLPRNPTADTQHVAK